MSESSASGIYLRANWRNAEDYRPLLDYDCAGWAGEWLRRNPAFIADRQRAPCFSQENSPCASENVRIVTCEGTCKLARWGLRCCHLDNDPVFFWLPQSNSSVLSVEAVATSDACNAFDLRQCPLLKAVLRGK